MGRNDQPTDFADKLVSTFASFFMAAAFGVFVLVTLWVFVEDPTKVAYWLFFAGGGMLFFLLRSLASIWTTPYPAPSDQPSEAANAPWAPWAFLKLFLAFVAAVAGVPWVLSAMMTRSDRPETAPEPRAAAHARREAPIVPVEPARTPPSGDRGVLEAAQTPLKARR